MIKPLVLFFPFPLLSHYSRCLMLANDLRDNFEIRFADDEQYHYLIYQNGFSTFSCENFDAQKVLADSRKFSFEWLNETDLNRVFISQVNCISTLSPDLVLGDTAFTLKMASEKCNVKMISLINGYMSRHYALTRRVPHTHPAFRYSQKIPATIFDLITRFMEQLEFSRVHAPFNQIRKQSSLPRVNNYLDELTGDITLLCDLPELFPQKKLPINFDFIGPLFYQSENDEQEVISKLDRSKPSILVSMGSTGEWEKLTMICKEKFSGFNIITAGDEAKVLQGPNIISKTFVNNTAVLPYMDIMICHGGNGTIYQALLHSVPVLCFTSMFEQEWNMNRIKELNLGQFINDLNEDELFETINKWILNKQVVNFAEQVKKYDSQFRTRLIKQISERLFRD